MFDYLKYIIFNLHKDCELDSITPFNKVKKKTTEAYRDS